MNSTTWLAVLAKVSAGSGTFDDRSHMDECIASMILVRPSECVLALVLELAHAHLKALCTDRSHC